MTGVGRRGNETKERRGAREEKENSQITITSLMCFVVICLFHSKVTRLGNKI